MAHDGRIQHAPFPPGPSLPPLFPLLFPSFPFLFPSSSFSFLFLLLSENATHRYREIADNSFEHRALALTKPKGVAAARNSNCQQLKYLRTLQACRPRDLPPWKMPDPDARPSHGFEVSTSRPGWCSTSHLPAMNANEAMSHASG